MKSYQATWEDAEASRQVELVVNYQLDSQAGRHQRRHSDPRDLPLPQEPAAARTSASGPKAAAAARRQAAAAGRLATLAQEIAEGQLHELKHAVDKAGVEATPVMQA